MSYLEKIVSQFPIRRKAEQKKAFRDWAVTEIRAMGYNVKVEQNGVGCHENIVVGDPEKAPVLFTAHYDTPSTIGLPNLMMPRNPVLAFAYVMLMVLILLGEFSWGYLPFHLCGINILLILFDTVKQTKTVRCFLYYFAIPGAALALLFPNWTKMPLWNFFHIHSFTIHILLVLYPLLLVTTGQVSTDLRSALKGVALLIAMAIPVYGLNLLWDTNFMFLMEPDSGNPLELFEKLLGSHLWGFPILLPIVVLVMYLPLRLLKKRKI